MASCRRSSAGPVDAQQDGFFGKRSGADLAAEPHDDVASANLEQRPARGLVVGVADVMRQGVDAGADLIPGLGLPGLLAGPLDFPVPAGGAGGTSLELAQIHLHVRPE